MINYLRFVFRPLLPKYPNIMRVTFFSSRSRKPQSWSKNYILFEFFWYFINSNKKVYFSKDFHSHWSENKNKIKFKELTLQNSTTREELTEKWRLLSKKQKTQLVFIYVSSELSFRIEIKNPTSRNSWSKAFSH